MEQIIAGLIEKSLVGGAFVLLLWKFITDFSKSQRDIVLQMGKMNTQMVKMSGALSDVSNTLSNLDERVRMLEEEKK